MTREPVQIDARRAMTPARKRRIHQAWSGCCWICKLPVPESGPGVVYDHINPLWIAGSDADEAIAPSHKACDRPKTAKDQTDIAKIKRLLAWVDGTRRERKPIQSHGFQKKLTKGFDGVVRPRQERTK